MQRLAAPGFWLLCFILHPCAYRVCVYILLFYVGWGDIFIFLDVVKSIVS